MSGKVELFLEIQHLRSRAARRAQVRSNTCAQARGQNLTYISSNNNSAYTKKINLE